MRFSTVFEPKPVPLTYAQVQARVLASQADEDGDSQLPPPQDAQEDLAQRVREVGEWQLEDW